MLHFLRRTTTGTSDRIILVDIGAAGGLQRKWHRHLRHIRPVLFEPNPEEAARLRPALSRSPDAVVVEAGLAAASGTYTLNIAHWPGCTSLRASDPDVLAGYKIAPLYETVDRMETQCVRYDELCRAGTVPEPDVIKVDVEGYEYEVLEGFGDLLHGVIGIEAEAWLYPVFKGQKMLHDIVTLLSSFGLYLRRIEEVSGFEGDLVCVNAYFTRGKASHPNLSQAQISKFELLQKVWGLSAA